MSEISVREQSVQLSLSTEQLKFIANTEFVNKSLRGNLPAILACVAYGRALGIADMVALNHIHMIDGSPSESAELLVMLVRRRGHSIVGGTSSQKATATGTRCDNGDTITVEWTMEDAKTAGLAGKKNWTQYGPSMLWARAVSQLCRMLFADCFFGGTYTPDELGAEHVDAAGVPVDEDREFPPVDANGEIIAPGSKPVISEAQCKRLWTIATDANVPEPRLRELVKQYAGVESTKLIPRDCYDPLCEAVMAEVFSPPEETFEERAARAQATRDAES